MDSAIDLLAGQGFFFSLVLAGLVLIFLGLIGRIKGKIDLSFKRQFFVVIFGLIFVALGILGYLRDIETSQPKKAVLLSGDITQIATFTPPPPLPSPTEEQPPAPTPTNISTATKMPIPTYTPTNTPALSPSSPDTPIPPTSPSANASGALQERICGPVAFEDDSHNSRNPLFKRPEGYTSGWVTSDPSTIVLPDGTQKALSERYALIVEDLPEVQFLNVPYGASHANIWGCWNRSDLASKVSLAAEGEYEKLLKPAEYYRISVAGIERLR